MSEIMLAIGRDHLSRVTKIDRSTIERTMGVKVLANETYKRSYQNGKSPTIDYAAASRLSRVSGAKNVMIDAKFANDTPQEMVDAVRFIVSATTHPPLKSDLHRVSKIPEMLTVHHIVPVDSLVAFSNEARQHKVAPICFLTSSRFSEQDFEVRGTSATRNAESLAEYISDDRFGITGVVCAAVDAPIIKNVNSSLTTYATGAYYDTDEIGRHPRSTSIDSVTNAVDVFIIGSAILGALQPTVELEKRLAAIGR
jgi:orotidine-5'-phosphate decarboxylase